MSHSGKINHDTSEPHAFGIFISIFISFVFVAVSMIGAYFYYKGTLSNELNAKENVPVPEAIQKLRAYENKELSTAAWLNKSKTVARIPIEDAIEIVTKEYQR